jgi:hypothetical protein
VRSCVLLVLASAVAACSGSSGCQSTAPCDTARAAAQSLTGSWTEVQAWRGISLQISLGAVDTTLSGTATYNTTDAGSGTAQITGYVVRQDAAFVPSGEVSPAHPIVVLNFTFSNGLAARFDQAVLPEQNKLTGALTFSDEPFKTYGTTFLRAAP